MSKNKKGPYILIGGLLIILFFTFGVKLGQRVEKTNKTIGYILSITPLPKINLSPTASEKQIGYELYKNKVCEISFLYPNNLEIQESSNSANFKNFSKLDLISFDCTKTDKSKEILNDIEISTSEALFKNKKIIVSKNTVNNTTMYNFNFINPRNGKNIKVKIDEKLYPLFESTLEYSVN